MKNSGLEEAKLISENADITYGNHNGERTRMCSFHLRRLQGEVFPCKRGFYLRQENAERAYESMRKQKSL